jgi:hypothetical protein
MRHSSLGIATLLFCIAVPCHGYCQAQEPATQPLLIIPADRISADIDDAERIILKEGRGAAPTQGSAGAEVAPGLRMQKVILSLKPDPAQQKALDWLSEAQQDPASAYFHAWLTPQSYAAHFGLSRNDRSRIVQWLVQHRMQVDESMSNGRALVLSGTAEDFEATFHTVVRPCEDNGQVNCVTAGNIEIPAALSPVIDGIVFTGDSREAEAMDSEPEFPVTGLAEQHNMTALHNLGMNGANVTIELARHSELDAKRQPKLLELEWIRSLAPGASVNVLAATSTNANEGALLAAVDIVNRNRADILKMETRLCEAKMSAAAARFLRSLWQQAAVQGTTVVASGCECGDRQARQSSSISAAIAAGMVALVSQVEHGREGSVMPALLMLAGGSSELRSSLDGCSPTPWFSGMDALHVVNHWGEAIAAASRSAAGAALPLPAAMSSPASAAGTAAAPVLFYSDLDSGPASGGENGNGAFLCVYGENFGGSGSAGKAPARAAMKLDSTPLVNYKVWSDPGAPYLPGHYAKACGQIPSSVAAGNHAVSLTTSAGRSGGSGSYNAANPLTFTVRNAGHIYFAGCASGATGCTPNDHTGKPFATLKACKNALTPGDICYLHASISPVTTVDSGWAILWLQASGTPGNPMAVAAYPGETVVLDASGTPGLPLKVWLSAGGKPTPGNGVNYWTVAGLTLFGGNSEMTAEYTQGQNHRFVDNDVSGPELNGEAGALLVQFGNAIQPAQNLYIYGNRIHDIGCADPDTPESWFQYSPGRIPSGVTAINSGASSAGDNPHPCSWVKAGTGTSSGTTVSTIVAKGALPSSIFNEPVVLYAINPASTPANQMQVRRMSVSATTPCQATSKLAWNCISETNPVNVFTIDQPFSPDLPASGITLYARYSSASKTEHHVYFGDYVYNIDFAWNEVDGSEGHACRGIQFFHGAVPNAHDIFIHHNYIHDTVCDAINLNTIDPSFGPVQVYDNLIINGGAGVSSLIPDPEGGGANYSAFYLSNSGTPLPYFANESNPTTGGKGKAEYTYTLVESFPAGTVLGDKQSFASPVYISGGVQGTADGHAVGDYQWLNAPVTLNSGASIRLKTPPLPAVYSGSPSWWIYRTALNSTLQSGWVAQNLAAAAVFIDDGLVPIPGPGGALTRPSGGRCVYWSTALSAWTPCHADQVQVFNNTMVNGGANQDLTGMEYAGTNGAVVQQQGMPDPLAVLALTNNIITEPSNAVPYWLPYSHSNLQLSASGNLCNGAGLCPTGFTASQAGDPGFVGERNYHITLGPAAAAGVRTLFAAFDTDGQPQSSPPSIGSFVSALQQQ